MTSGATPPSPPGSPFPATGNFDLAAGALRPAHGPQRRHRRPRRGFRHAQPRQRRDHHLGRRSRLRHRDNGSPTATELGPGCAQHSPPAPASAIPRSTPPATPAGETVRVVQSWLPTDQRDTPPFHASHDFTPALVDAPLVPVAGPSSPLPLGTAGAALWAGRPGADVEVPLPPARYLHVYVIRGRVSLAGVDLDEGDVARLVDHGPVTARALADTELLVWAMDQALRDLTLELAGLHQLPAGGCRPRGQE
ncbi:hypothetical protein QP028_06780 [Corynebacterium suedekumii]|nr:hypothetical protein QP028_06780 [Corynebacterium suedekumii]